MSATEIKGILPVILMPYTEAGELAEDDFFVQTEHILDVGCDGFVIGQVSEVLRLSGRERLRVARLCAQAVEARGVSIMSTGAESTAGAIEFSLQAQEAGVDALLVMHPTTLPLDDSEMFEYFAGVIEAVDIPVLVHHAKSFARLPLSIDVQVRLLAEYGPERVMFKPEAAPTPPRVSELRDGTNGQARIFEGDGGMMLIDCFHRGLTGTIPATEVAEIIVALWRLLEAGDAKRAAEVGYRLSYLMCHMMNSVDCYATIAKHLLKRRGLITTTKVRGPSAYHLDPETRAEVERIYDELFALAGGYAIPKEVAP